MIKKLLNYQIEDWLGSSMHAEVYKASPLGQSDNMVVIKKSMTNSVAMSWRFTCNSRSIIWRNCRWRT
nr:hypothetical protein [Methylomarinum sp. Ch1-1]MDP4522563.1 hypothetical protein [Methylomarinum sp. Ch1-1]